MKYSDYEKQGYRIIDSGYCNKYEYKETKKELLEWYKEYEPAVIKVRSDTKGLTCYWVLTNK